MIIRYSRNNLECYFRVNSGLSISISIIEIVNVWVILFFYALDFFGVSVFSVIICFMTIWAVRLMQNFFTSPRQVRFLKG